MNLSKILNPPTIPNDPELQLVANTLHKVLLWFVAIVFGGVTLVVVEPRESYLSFIYIFSTLGVMVCNYAILKAGYVKLAAKLLVVMLMIALTSLSLSIGGVQAYSHAYFLTVIALAFMTLGVKWGMGTIFGSLSAVTLVGYLQTNGFVHPIPVTGQPSSNALALANRILSIIATGMFFYLGTNGMNRINQMLRESQRKEKSSAEQLQLITDSLPIRVGFVDENETVIFANRMLRNGKSPIGMRLDEFEAPINYAHLSPYIKRAIAGHATSFEYKKILENNEERILAVDYIPHQLSAEKGGGFFALIDDVTEQRQAEKVLRQTQRLESLGLLAGGIAHDFNNLLVAILGQTSLAKAKLDADSPAMRHIDKAVTASHQASGLTHQMLAYSGRGQFEVRQIDLNDLLLQNLHLFEASISKNIRIVTNFSNELPLIKADTAQMQQVMMNLIINAAQAIGDAAGQITLATQAVEVHDSNNQELLITGQSLDPGLYVAVDVEDDGCGMVADQIAKIFDPFYSTKKSGNGLGLSAVLGIIRGHNGGIRVDSQIGKGTKFCVMLPVSAELAPTSHMPEPITS